MGMKVPVRCPDCKSAILSDPPGRFCITYECGCKVAYNPKGMWAIIEECPEKTKGATG
jgi:hypothetical protein